MNGIILYKSKYGATKKYAEWLSEETGFECVEIKKADIKMLDKYDIIILGGGIYAMGIACMPFLKKNISKLSGKRVIIYFCCASPYEKSAIQQIKEFNMKDELANIPCFYCRGAWDKDLMSFKDRTLCNMLRKAVEKKDPADYEIWERALIEAGDNKCDWTDKEYLKPIIEEINR